MLTMWETITRKLFERTYEGEEYLRCLCWDCEALLSAAEREDLITTTSADWVKNIAAKVWKDVQYYRAVEMARCQGQA